MKDLVRGFVKWLIIVLATLCAVTWTAAIVHCQDTWEIVTPTPEPTPQSPRFEAHPRHSDRWDAEDDMGFMSVKILSVDAHYVYAVRESKSEVKALAFRYDDLTQFDQKGGFVCLVYCRTHLFVYVVTSCRR